MTSAADSRVVALTVALASARAAAAEVTSLRRSAVPDARSLLVGSTVRAVSSTAAVATTVLLSPLQLVQDQPGVWFVVLLCVVAGVVVPAVHLAARAGSPSALFATLRLPRQVRARRSFEHAAAVAFQELCVDDDDEMFDRQVAEDVTDDVWLALVAECRWRYQCFGMVSHVDVSLQSVLGSVRREPAADLTPLPWWSVVSARTLPVGNRPSFELAIPPAEPFEFSVEFVAMAARARLAGAVCGPSTTWDVDPMVWWLEMVRLEVAGVDAVKAAGVLAEGGHWKLTDLVDTAVMLTAVTVQ